MMIDFEDMLKTYVNRKKSDYVHEIDVIKPSQVGLCMRYQYLSEADIKPHDEKLLKIFLHGNFIHDFAYKIIRNYYFGKKNVAVINEYPLRYEINGIPVNGFVDDLLIIDQNFIPIEIKSIGGKFYKLKAPSYEHVIQLMFYLYGLKAKYGYIVYIHKDDLETKTFRIEFDEVFFKEKVLSRVDKYFEYVNNGYIPPAEGLLGTSTWLANTCKNCKYREFCESIGKEAYRDGD